MARPHNGVLFIRTGIFGKASTQEASEARKQAIGKKKHYQIFFFRGPGSGAALRETIGFGSAERA
jgi:hypothetical protein